MALIDFEEFRKESTEERSWAKAVFGYKAICIWYAASGEKELCIYDPNIIEEIQY